MSTALPTSSAGQPIPLAALGCSSAIASQQELRPTLPSTEDASPLLSDNLAEHIGHHVPSPQCLAPITPETPAAVLSDLHAAPHADCVDRGLTSSLPGTHSTRKHRVAEVREQQGVSQRTLARRLGIEVKALQALEQPDSDLCLSQLMALQAALDVPLIDLLEECPSLSRPIAERAKMVKVMKTAVALRETKSNRQVERMAQMLCEQLTELMPELAEVSGWPQFGSRRGTSALGKALSQPIDTTNLGLPD